MHARLDPLRHRPLRTRPGRVRAAARSEQTSIARPQPSDAPPAAAEDASRPLRDRGVSLLAVFTGATLLIVALVCLVASIDRWWILIPVMAVDLTVTGAVLAVMASLLDDGSSS